MTAVTPAQKGYLEDKLLQESVPLQPALNY